MRVERRLLGASPRARRGDPRAGAGGAVGAGAVAEIIAAVAAEGDAAVRATRRASTRDPPPPQRVSGAELTAALVSARPRGARRPRSRDRERRRGRLGRDRRGPRDPAAQGHRIVLREIPVARAGRLRAGRPRAVPEHRRMGAVTARAAGVGGSSSHAAAGRIRSRLPPARSSGVAEVLRDGRRPGDRGARPRDRDRRARRRDRRSRQPLRAGGQAAARRPRRDRRLRRAERPARALRRIRRRLDPPDALDLLAQAEHGEASLVVAVAPDAALLDALEVDLRGLAGGAASAPCVLVEAASIEAALEFCEAFAPEHLELIGPGAEALAPRVRSAGCLFVGWPSGTAFGDYVAGSNHILPTGGSARFASALDTRASAGGWRRCTSTTALPSRCRLAGVPLARAEGFDAHARSMAARTPGHRGQSASMRRAAEITRNDRARPSVSLRLALDGTGAGTRADRRRLPRPHARPARAPRAPRPRRRGRGDLETGAHHTVEDVCIVLGQALDAGARRPQRHPPLRPGDRADGRGARAVRDRHLGAPAAASSPPSCRPARPAASSTSCSRSSSARSPTSARSPCTSTCRRPATRTT